MPDLQPIFESLDFRIITCDEGVYHLESHWGIKYTGVIHCIPFESLPSSGIAKVSVITHKVPEGFSYQDESDYWKSIDIRRLREYGDEGFHFESVEIPAEWYADSEIQKLDRVRKVIGDHRYIGKLLTGDWVCFN